MRRGERPGAMILARGSKSIINLNEAERACWARSGERPGAMILARGSKSIINLNEAERACWVRSGERPGAMILARGSKSIINLNEAERACWVRRGERPGHKILRSPSSYYGDTNVKDITAEGTHCAPSRSAPPDSPRGDPLRTQQVCSARLPPRGPA